MHAWLRQRSCFNPHSHVGSDEVSWKWWYIPACFNPHSHVGSDNNPYVSSEPLEGFNPHSHVGSDATTPQPSYTVTVSIHTPTWGVTAVGRKCARKTHVSIHTPTWGVTLKAFIVALTKKFQSTLPRGA